MSWTLTVDGTDRSSIVRRTQLRAGGQAHEGQVGTGGGFDLDDLAAAVDLPGRVPWSLTTDDSTPATVLARGRIGPKSVSRAGMFSGDSRGYDVQLDDGNTHLYGIVVDLWSRPAESDYARVQALAAAFLSGSGSSSPRARATTDLDCTTYVPNTNTVTMPKKRYDATNPAAVLADCRASSGKEFFVTVDDELFYDVPLSTAYAAGLSITDDAPNLTDEFPPIFEGQAASQDPSEFISGALGVYGNPPKRATDFRSAPAADHDKWEVGVHLDATTTAQANAELDTLVDNQSVEEERFECTLELRGDEVALIKYGQTVSFRAAAAATLTPRVVRVGRLMWEAPGADGAPWRAHLELGFPKKVAPRIKKGTPLPEGIPIGDTPPPSIYCADIEEQLADTAGSLGPSDLTGTWSTHHLYTSDGSVDAVGGYAEFLAGNTLIAGETLERLDLSTPLVPPLRLTARWQFPPLAPGRTAPTIDGSDQYTAAISTKLKTTLGGTVITSQVQHVTVEGPALDPAIWHPNIFVDGGPAYPASLAAIAAETVIEVRADGHAYSRAAGGGYSGGWIDHGAVSGNLTRIDLEVASGKTDEGVWPGTNPSIVYLTALLARSSDGGPCGAFEPAVVGGQYPVALVGIGDGVTDTYPIPTAFVVGTLKVYVEGIRAVPVVVDPIALTFQLGFDVPTGFRVEVEGQVAA